MKKLAYLLIAAMLLSMISCGQKTGTEGKEPSGNQGESQSQPDQTEEEETLPYKAGSLQATVNNPTSEWPCYKLSENATVEEMRATAVQAMHDSLSYKWTPLEEFKYTKTGAGANYDYHFFPYNVYAGILYAGGGGGLFQWLAAIHPETGVLYNLNFANIAAEQGSSCSAAVCWALLSVSTSVPGPLSSHHLVPKNGFYPLGPVEYPDYISDFKAYATDRICKENGDQKVYEGYALALPGDPLVSSGNDDTDVHAMMVFTAPNVVRNADNTIDGAKSTIKIKDQRFKDTPYDVDGQQVYYRGRTEYEYTFEELYKKYYIAVTIAEFMEGGKYTPAEAKLNKEATALKDLIGARIESNYPVCIAYARVFDENGKKVMEEMKTTNAQEVNAGTAENYNVGSVLTKTALRTNLIEGQNYKCEVEVVLSTGEHFTVASLDFTYED